MNPLGERLGLGTWGAIARVRTAMDALNDGRPLPALELAAQADCPLLGTGGSRIVLDVGGGWALKVPADSGNAEINALEWSRMRDLQELPFIPEIRLLSGDLLLVERLVPLDHPSLRGPDLRLPVDLHRALRTAQHALRDALDEMGEARLIDPDYAFNWGLRMGIDGLPTPAQLAAGALKVLDLGD